MATNTETPKQADETKIDYTEEEAIALWSAIDGLHGILAMMRDTFEAELEEAEVLDYIDTDLDGVKKHIREFL